MSQLKKMSGWDDRGNGDEGAIADAQRLWLGNLAKDLSQNAFVDWLKEVGFEALEILPLVTGVMMAENMISDTECPHPTVTPNLAALSVWTCSRNCRAVLVTGVMMGEEMISDTGRPRAIWYPAVRLVLG